MVPKPCSTDSYRWSNDDDRRRKDPTCNAQTAMDIGTALLNQCGLPYKERHPRRHHCAMQVEKPRQRGVVKNSFR